MEHAQRDRVGNDIPNIGHTGARRRDCKHQCSRSKENDHGCFRDRGRHQRPQEKVFDVVTTTGHWPYWAHLAERPFQLGDPIYEFCRTPTGPQEVLWRITEYDRPRRAKLVAEDGTSITYIFTGQGDDTSFRRVFDLGSVLGAQQPLPYTIDTARSENANVKALVERILSREQKGRNLP
jgi:hypothetical protein